MVNKRSIITIENKHTPTKLGGLTKNINSNTKWNKLKANRH